MLSHIDSPFRSIFKKGSFGGQHLEYNALSSLLLTQGLGANLWLMSWVYLLPYLRTQHSILCFCSYPISRLLCCTGWDSLLVGVHKSAVHGFEERVFLCLLFSCAYCVCVQTYSYLFGTSNGNSYRGICSCFGCSCILCFTITTHNWQTKRFIIYCLGDEAAKMRAANVFDNSRHIHTSREGTACSTVETHLSNREQGWKQWRHRLAQSKYPQAVGDSFRL